jgi:hypothetical protein
MFSHNAEALSTIVTRLSGYALAISAAISIPTKPPPTISTERAALSLQ